MFTGIVEGECSVLKQEKRDNALCLTLERPEGWVLVGGQSIAIDGACLTVELFDEESFTVTLIPETLDKTTFGKTIPKSVNVERAMVAGDRLDGHMVQGHVDTVGTVQDIFVKGLSVEMVIKYDVSFTDLTVAKGSVAVNGVSLTIVHATEDTFSVMLIPHTLEVTTLRDLRAGDAVNLEFDIIGKYITKRKTQ